MLHLITGTPGSGKTLYAVSLIIKYVEENKKRLEEGKEPRNIYADIDGLDIDGVESAPDDWRDTPDGSVIFYDEIQQREFFKKAKDDNDVVNALQIHRHTGHDIYGITQFPVLLHSNFKAIVGLHYHLHRGWGLHAATVYQWAYCVDAPNAPSNKRLAENTFRFSYPRHLYSYYKSATVHTHKARIPKKFIAIIIAVLILGYFAVSLLFDDKNFVTKVASGKADEKSLTSPVSAGVPASAVVSASSVDVAFENADKKLRILEIKQKLDELEYQNKMKTMPTSVITMNGRCQAYNYDGVPIELSYRECKKYANREKPLFVPMQQPLKPAVSNQNVDIEDKSNQEEQTKPQNQTLTINVQNVPASSVSVNEEGESH